MRRRKIPAIIAHQTWAIHYPDTRHGPHDKACAPRMADGGGGPRREAEREHDTHSRTPTRVNHPSPQFGSMTWGGATSVNTTTTTTTPTPPAPTYISSKSNRQKCRYHSLPCCPGGPAYSTLPFATKSSALCLPRAQGRRPLLVCERENAEDRQGKSHHHAWLWNSHVRTVPQMSVRVCEC